MHGELRLCLRVLSPAGSKRGAPCSLDVGLCQPKEQGPLRCTFVLHPRRCQTDWGEFLSQRFAFSGITCTGVMTTKLQRRGMDRLFSGFLLCLFSGFLFLTLPAAKLENPCGCVYLGNSESKREEDFKKRQVSFSFLSRQRQLDQCSLPSDSIHRSHPAPAVSCTPRSPTTPAKSHARSALDPSDDPKSRLQV